MCTKSWHDSSPPRLKLVDYQPPCESGRGWLAGWFKIPRLEVLGLTILLCLACIGLHFVLADWLSARASLAIAWGASCVGGLYLAARVTRPGPG